MNDVSIRNTIHIRPWLLVVLISSTCTDGNSFNNRKKAMLLINVELGIWEELQR